MSTSTSAQALVHLHRNFVAVIEAMNTTIAGFARRAGIVRRALAYRFNPLADVRVRGTSLDSLSRVAAAAECSVAWLHMTPDDIEVLLGRSYDAHPNLRGVSIHRSAQRVASHLRDIGTPNAAMVKATIAGVALSSFEAAEDLSRRLHNLQRT